MEYYFNVAKNGRHLFRTDTYNHPQHVDDIQIALTTHFRAVDGYTIELSMRDPSWECKEIAN